VSTHGSALDTLAAQDRILGKKHGVLGTLCPDRHAATPLATLGEALLVGVEAEVSSAWARGLARIAEAQSRHFPGNLFWDLDYPAARLLAFALDGGGGAEGARERLEQMVKRVEELDAAYGAHSSLRFRYVHDFVYGFDWARWVKRRVDDRGSVGPFSPTFLEYLLERSEEIEALVAAKDEKYIALGEGEHRNPFGLSREPQAEERLHRDLAHRGLIPIEAWRTDAEPRWDRAFSTERRKRALALGLGRPK
jgi:hypothetical protein